MRAAPGGAAPRERVLVIAHGHPELALGGGEIAAHALFRALRAHPAVEEAWFLARVESADGPTGAITLRREGEYLWAQGLSDWHLLRSAHPASMDLAFTELLEALAPTVVHVHHYVRLGLELLRTLRRVLPRARIVLTMHEYMAICRHDGQMARRGTLAPCERDSPEDCHRCFPEHAPEDFWLRRRWVRHHLGLVDRFVAPSRFLRDRHVAWGLDAGRIAVIDNGQPDEAPLPPRAPDDPGPRARFAFLGQVNPYKGLDVLLEALHRLPRATRSTLSLQLHGAHLERQPAALRDRLCALIDPLVAEGAVDWRGPYDPGALRARLADVDWVLVPSIWWENSPLVIQEAFRCGRPVLCSDIGGMAEKVRHDVDGLHVPAGDRDAWGRTLARLAAEPDGATWHRLRRGVRPPLTHARCVEAHLAWYRGETPPGPAGEGDAPAREPARVLRLARADRAPTSSCHEEARPSAAARRSSGTSPTRNPS